ncbi:hypothetical protein RchiOBHm_Chr5g0079681 [Rosa chinensis]|uniref:Uncharacterized protein n=1 Tax=Rosa chinensis TaxID=74649 RepID=A0A2P6QML4_ROSCH|nr:hypothetical protein RchiOBHm_Chr5g0079681 [Rosa chinensis]
MEDLTSAISQLKLCSRSIMLLTRFPHLITLRQVGKLKCPTDKSSRFWRKLLDHLGRIGANELMMHYGHVGQHIRRL